MSVFKVPPLFLFTGTHELNLERLQKSASLRLMPALLICHVSKRVINPVTLSTTISALPIQSHCPCPLENGLDLSSRMWGGIVFHQLAPGTMSTLLAKSLHGGLILQP